MTTFKDLLSKDLQNQIKEIGDKKPTPSNNNNQPKQKSTIPHTKNQAMNQNHGFGGEPMDEEKALFMQAMNGVRPLKFDKSVTQKPKKTDDNALFRRANAEGVGEMQATNLSDMQALLNPVAGEAFLSYKNPTIQNKVFEQLKQGKLRWYDAVDLHGSSIDDAREGVLTLINNATKNGENVVKIVHGKGTDAIIKTCVNGWLRQISDVLAFVSAPANDGGTGAVLVLLKKKKLG